MYDPSLPATGAFSLGLFVIGLTSTYWIVGAAALLFSAYLVGRLFLLKRQENKLVE